MCGSRPSIPDLLVSTCLSDAASWTCIDKDAVQPVQHLLAGHGKVGGDLGELDDIIQALPLSTLATNEPLGPWLAHPSLPNAYTRHRVWSSSSGIHDDTRQIVQHTNTRPGRLTIGRGSIRFIGRAIHIVQ